MKKKALIVQGGWDGHEPEQVAEIFRKILEEENFNVEIADTLDAYADLEKLQSLDLIVPHWTMGEIKQEYVNNVSQAVISGVGLAGCHGGMCDAFRNNVDWQFMTGGNWVAHPGNDGIEYMVHIKDTSTLLAGMEDFKVVSEQYYLHVDPAVKILATTKFPVADGPHTSNGSVDMPVVWKKSWGAGRVFYNSLGHASDIVAMPEVSQMMRKGFLWAAEGKILAQKIDKVSHENNHAYTGMGDSQ